MAKYSRQTYQAVADILYDERMHAEENYESHGYGISVTNATVARVTQRFAAMFAADNERFDAERFDRAVYRDHEE